MDTHNTDSTKQLLTDSLRRLMRQKPLNKISIREITEDCGVNRQTFYYHFQDIHDQVSWMFHQDARTLLPEEELTWQEGLLRLFRYLDENREICLCILHSVAHEQLRRFFHTAIFDLIRQSIEQITEHMDVPPAQKTIMTHFYVSALSGMVESWLLGELPYTPEELVATADRIIADHHTGALLQKIPMQHSDIST